MPRGTSEAQTDGPGLKPAPCAASDQQPPRREPEASRVDWTDNGGAFHTESRVCAR